MNEGRINERLDELLLIEERAERRSESLVELIKGLEEDRKKVVLELTEKMELVDHSLKNIGSCSKIIENKIQSAEKVYTNSIKAIKIVLWSLIAILLLLSFVVDHEVKKFNMPREEFNRINSKLQRTATFGDFNGRQLVRVRPNSEARFTGDDNQPMPGVYAEVWHYGDD